MFVPRISARAEAALLELHLGIGSIACSKKNTGAVFFERAVQVQLVLGAQQLRDHLCRKTQGFNWLPKK